MDKWLLNKDWFTLYVHFNFSALRKAMLCLVGRHGWIDHRELGKRCVYCGHWKSPEASEEWLGVAEVRLKSAGMM